MVQPSLVLEGITSLEPTVVLTWSSDVNSTGPRIAASVQDVSLVSIAAFTNSDRIASVAALLASLFEAQNVARVLVVGALDVVAGKEVVTAALHCQTKSKLHTLNPSVPLNDRFLGALVVCLRASPSIQTTLLALPAKKERSQEDGRVLARLQGEVVDEGIDELVNEVQSFTGLKFNADVARTVVLPHFAARRKLEQEGKVEKKDDLLLMYM
ncbi:hypothetical protein BCR33DRAFT_716410 [Rhizoclosmatium globosum]|uniref:Uncharacterized protein n=1 Tax=Rhizoclosmatium globosum TaxID=329046 RepID=A0A1Y2CDT9_9FUNG|nr:hypothetical protein BCR33DRAFT_716410 [Rhizoclosmatium globosum]|eukprot:ORY45057.1 hypothetical protein BCR33DRAFT_716410 [Rhizoclosmatium globosum]